MTDKNIEESVVVQTEEVKKVIGEFTPKRKFLNFVSGVSGARIRLISDIAFVKGDKLTGIGLDGVIFKVTICDEGTINFEEVDTALTDLSYRKRLIDDICDRDVVGYTKKFVVADLEFADKDGTRCYLEVENAKPIDKLKSLLDDKAEISDKGLKFLDELFGSDVEEDSDPIETEPVMEVIEVKEEKNHAESMMEESFRKMNEDKVKELKGRVEDKETEIKNTRRELENAEKKIKTSADQLRVLNSRLETMSPVDEPNGYVFFVSDEQKNELGIDDTTKAIADKIADLMNLKKDILFQYLTGGFYKIKIGKKGENDKKLESIDREILEKISSADPLGKFSMSDTNEIEYRGDLNWHQLTGKMIRKGFEQDPEFNKISGSNSYESKVEDDGKNFTGTKDESKEKCSHDCENCKCSDEIPVTDEIPDKDDETNGVLKIHIKGVDENYGMTSFKSKVIRTFDEPTNIVILGADHNGRDIEITDDFAPLDFYIGGKKVRFGKFDFETEGHVSILTLDKYKEWIDENKDTGLFDAVNAVLLPGFKGDIGVGLFVNDKFIDNFDHENYIWHQDEFCGDNEDMEYPEVFISLPDLTTIELIKDHDLSTIISHLRDVTIDKIIKK